MSRSISYRDAINESLRQEMERDSSVFTYGIDVGDHKRIFGSTNGLIEQFGEKRCFSTPLCEDAMTGFGLGAAISGLRPIHVHMRADFMLLAVNQLFNMVSSFCYGSGGKQSVPFVIRAIIGRGWGQAYQHSKSMHSIFAHIPGLKVVMPSSPYEAKGLLTAAIRENNPVIVFEHRWLYDVEGHVPEEPYALPLDGSSMRKVGSDLTIIATSWMNVEAMQAAEILEREGISVEVIDAYSITGFNDEMIMESVNKTRKCIIIDNDWTYCGFSAELATLIYEKCLDRLDLPVKRMGFEHAPCPCTRPLENEFYANAVSLIRTAESFFDLPTIDLSQDKFYSYENKFRGPF